MKLHRSLISLVCCFTLLAQSAPSYGQFSATYQYYIDLANESITKSDSQSFQFYLEAAHSADPSAEEPFELLKNVQIFQSNRQLLRGYLLQAIEALERDSYRTALFYFQLSLLVTPDDSLIQEYIDYVNKLIRGEIVDKTPLMERIKKEYKLEVPIEAQIEIEKEVSVPPKEEKETVVAEEDEAKLKATPKTTDTQAIEKVERPAIKVRQKPAVGKEPPAKIVFVQEADVETVIPMDDELWAKQPNTAIEIEFHKAIILEGQNIDRWLVLNENYIEVGRLDRNRIQITSLRRGSTLFHVWDDRGRWTFNIVGVLPLVAEEGLRRSREELWEEYVDPFRLAYSNNWNAYYLGDSPKNLSRRSLVFTQFIGIYGGTPYGEFDASANFFKFEESTENTGRAIGLTNGKIGPFRDFTIRGYDTYKRFTDLSLPGRFFRGGLIDAYAFHRRLKYTYLRGQDRANFITISEGVTDIRRSYIEGARLTLNPDTEHQYSINFARAWGEERPPNLKDKVFSGDTEHQFGDLNLRGELAYDEDVYGSIIKSKYERDNYSLRINARDIDKDFTTITSRPGNQGEVGGNILYDWESDNGFTFNANADLYRDRDIPNPDNPDAINHDLGAYVSVPLSESLHFNQSVYYTDTPQLISPRRTLRVNSGLNKTFRVLYDRILSTHINASYQRSRFELTPQSEYDRRTVNAGFRLPIWRNLSYYLNYEQSWVDVIDTGEETMPSVLSMGLSYSQTFRDLISMHASVSWRDEEDTESNFSFLSGTDILRTNLGVSYHPSPDFEIFLDGSIRNVLAERSAEVAFHDADVRFGLRTAWDLIFGWNPKARINGYVFKDINKNGIREADEPGVDDMKVRIGEKIVTTGNTGYFARDVRAKNVKVALDLDSIPSGYNLTSDESKRIVIEQGKPVSVDFGLSVDTEIYGVIFVDENGNGLYDSPEKTVPSVKMILDREIVTRSDFEGIYSFGDVTPGEHLLSIDVNSIPLEYIPKIKLKNEIVVTEGSSYGFDVPLRRK